MRRTSAWAFAFIVLSACAADNGIVGGECATGYVRCGHACCLAPPTATANNPPESDSGLGPDDDGGGAQPDAQADAGSTTVGANEDYAWRPSGDGGCTPPLVACGNVCVDTDNDPMNCGSCGKVCPSNSCQNGLCQGNAAGHVIAVGHDYETSPSPASSQARVLSNAVLLSLSNPVRVLSYERYVSAKATANLKGLVQTAAQLQGRKVAFTSVVVDAAVPAMLDINAYDVLLVPDQRGASSGDLATLGGGWKQSGKIDAFLHGGGVVVALDGGSGVHEMPAFLGAADLLATTSSTVVTGALTVIAPNDAVGVGVVSPYVPTAGTVTLDTEPNGGTVVHVVTKQGLPVVVHKVVP